MRRPSSVNSSAPSHRSYRTFISSSSSSATHCGFTYSEYELDVETRVSIAVADLCITRKMPPPLARDALTKVQLYDGETTRLRYTRISLFKSAHIRSEE